LQAHKGVRQPLSRDHHGSQVVKAKNGHLVSSYMQQKYKAITTQQYQEHQNSQSATIKAQLIAKLS
jgi:hypothetical protein